MITKDKFCDLIREHERGMYAFSLSILKTPDDAADCLQESILKAYSKLDTLRSASKFKPWIMTVIHNTAIGMLRSRRETVELEEIGELSCEEKDVTVAVTLRDAVEKLKLPYRTVTVLFYYQGLPIKRIAEITSAEESTVRTQLARARKMLAQLLDKESLM